MVKKQAVLLIHGIGDQKPLETLRKFVTAAWTRNGKVHSDFAGDHYWSKPDDISESFELRKFTTPQNRSRVSTDFFELYWAHLMEGTTYGHVFAWIKTLMLRKPGSLSTQLKPVYWFLWVAALLALTLIIYTGVSLDGKERLLPAWASTLITLLLVPAVGFVVKNVVGDAARYLHVAPANVQSRHAIRHAGVKVLEELHKRGYSRIVVVGHSLGSVIGYDLLKHAWPLYNSKKPCADDAPHAELDGLEAMLQPGKELNRQDFRAAQARYLEELQGKERVNDWRVTDFVTLGSPLAHADVLLAQDEKDFARRRKSYELPSCPPELETQKYPDGSIRHGIAYPLKGDNRVPNHAALFAATRWTNLFFPCKGVVKGDVVGGPVAQLFGAGVEDIAVSTTIKGGYLSHTHYWSFGEQETRDKPLPGHIEALCRAIDIANDGYQDPPPKSAQRERADEAA
jgi:hypothetical protein